MITIALAALVGWFGNGAYGTGKEMRGMRTEYTQQIEEVRQVGYRNSQDIEHLGNYMASKPWSGPTPAPTPAKAQVTWRDVVPDGRGGL